MKIKALFFSRWPIWNSKHIVAVPKAKNMVHSPSIASHLMIVTNNQSQVTIDNDEDIPEYESRETGVRTRRCRQWNGGDNSSDRVYNTGKWSKEERLLFLKGLRKYGKGKWKKISTVVKTRSIRQVKSHGQKIFWKLEDGTDIFAELDESPQERQDCCPMIGHCDELTCLKVSEGLPRSHTKDPPQYTGEALYIDHTTKSKTREAKNRVSSAMPWSGSDTHNRPYELSTSKRLQSSGHLLVVSSKEKRISSPKHLSTAKRYGTGAWSKQEKILFFRGLKQFGKGKWKKISTVVGTRSVLQVKSHGQKICTKMEEGKDVFAELDQSIQFCLDENSANIDCSETLNPPNNNAFNTCLKKDVASRTSINLHEDKCRHENAENNDTSCSHPRIAKKARKTLVTPTIAPDYRDTICAALTSSNYERSYLGPTQKSHKNDKDKIAALALCELSIPGTKLQCM